LEALPNCVRHIVAVAPIVEKSLGGPRYPEAVAGGRRLLFRFVRLGAWLGLVPKQDSSGGKTRLGRITKRGDDYLRTLLIQGAKAAVISADKRDDPTSRWLAQLTARVGWQKACVAMANKNARILWAVMTRQESFDPQHVSVKPQAKPSAEQPMAVAASDPAAGVA